MALGSRNAVFVDQRQVVRAIGQRQGLQSLINRQAIGNINYRTSIRLPWKTGGSLDDDKPEPYFHALPTGYSPSLSSVAAVGTPTSSHPRRA